MKKILPAIYALCLALTISDQVQAVGVIRDSVGARSSGRGGTNIASADNGEIMLDNPAGMVNIESGRMFELGFDFLFTDLRYTNPQNPTWVNAWDNPVPLPNLSWMRKSDDGRWAFGLGLFAPCGMTCDYILNGLDPYFTGPQHYKTFGGIGKVLPGISYAVNDRLSVGGTLGLALSHCEIAGPYFLQSPGPLQGTPLKMASYSTGTALTWSAGLQYQWSDRTTIGLSYQSETCVGMHGNARVEIPILPDLGATELDAYHRIIWPQSAGLGIRHELCPHRILSADLVWTGWSSAFNKFNLNFTNPSNPAYAGIIGSGLAEQFPLRWRDSLSVKLGYERHLDDSHVIRLGYIYHRNPIPDEMLTAYIPVTLEHAFSAGYGWTTKKSWEVDLAYQFSWAPDYSVGDSALAGGDFSGSTNHVQAHWLFVSLMKRH
jgi:long-chain fatty acid transport protein